MSHVVDGYDFATDRHQQEFVLSRIPTGKGGKERGRGRRSGTGRRRKDREWD